MINVGKIIKSRRKKMGLSMEKLANSCGSSDSEILRIENGSRKKPNWQTLCKIASALGLHPLEILLAAGYISQTDIHPNVQIHGLEKLDDSGIKKVQLYIDFLISQEQKTNILEKNE